MTEKLFLDPFSTNTHPWRTGTGLGRDRRSTEVHSPTSAGEGELSASLLFALHGVGKHSDHFEVLFPPLEQCTWVWVLSALFIQ